VIVLLSTVALASLLGSLHCAAMCGPLAALAAGQVGRTDAAPKGRALRVLSGARNLLAYNGGRLAMYCALGAISGWVGAAIDLGGTVVGLQRVAATAAGITLIAFGVATLASFAGARVAWPGVPVTLQRLGGGVHRAVAAWPPALRAGATGVLSGLLPCGWLYAFVLIAGGTASALWGAAAMAAFWLGTLPMMLSLGLGLHHVFAIARARIPVITSLALVAIGLWTVFWRMELSGTALRPAFVRPVDVQQSVDAAASANSADRACCHGQER
jgi:sulfite exporter TauE/SafE